jgi:hypothetical protein
MSTVSANTSSNAYANYTRALLERSSGRGSSGTGGDATSSATSGKSGATVVTLSAVARAALAGGDKTEETQAAMLTRTKADLKTLIAAAKDGKPDLSKLDRRELYAIASNLDGSFDAKSVDAAKAEMKLRLGDALRGPEAAAEVTGKLGGLYSAADDFLDAAGPEEKASDAWKARKAAVATAEKKLKANPDADTAGIANDPVSEYFAGKKDGSAVRPTRDFAAVATDARKLIDALKKSTGKADADDLDLSKVDGRSLASIALNEGKQFDIDEIRAAKMELRARSRASLVSEVKGSDPRGLSLSIVSQYAGMSEEERTALGWTGATRANAVASYEQTSKVLSILTADGSDPATHLMSLASYL